MALASTQPLTEIRNLPGGKGRLARKADNSPPSVSRLFRKCGRLDVSQAYGSPRPVIGTNFFTNGLSNKNKMCPTCKIDFDEFKISRLGP
jgi:hypothetical protein